MKMKVFSGEPIKKLHEAGRTTMTLQSVEAGNEGTKTYQSFQGMSRNVDVKIRLFDCAVILLAFSTGKSP